ncbi:MAG: hypothetical protein CL489_01170 [Acidobacteria bacterium]|nr:hypothetical protein [Acidobacteriota bacterium]|tara:strand:+ start:1229 stop:1705 length:477 start_codon:yes stop_codon:yes gene_type:complete
MTVTETYVRKNVLDQPVEHYPGLLPPEMCNGYPDPRVFYEEDVWGIVDPGDIVASWFGSSCTPQQFIDFELAQRLEVSRETGLYDDIRDNGMHARPLGAKRADGTIDFMDGSHRIVVCHDLGRPVPMKLFNWFDLPAPCLTAWLSHPDMWVEGIGFGG